MTIKCNTGEREEIVAMFKEVTDAWGTVDVLVNNAGALSAMCTSTSQTCTRVTYVPHVCPMHSEHGSAHDECIEAASLHTAEGVQA